MKKALVFIFIFALLSGESKSQMRGEEHKFNPDTVFVFKSPRKLLTMSDRVYQYSNAAGGELFFSNSGFAFGGFYQMFLNESSTFETRFFITGARNSDEFEFYDYFTGDSFIPGKINRLYLMPLTFSYSRYLFRDILHKSLKPYVKVGAGPAFILSTPYSKSFFNALNYAKWYARFAGNVGIGAVIGIESGNYLRANIDYYYVPFGKNGLESMENKPIKTFGGIYISLSYGAMF